MTSDSGEEGIAASPDSEGVTLYDELVRNTLDISSSPRGDHSSGVESDHLIDVIRHGSLLEALLHEPLDRRGIEERLDVSRATSHRFVRWLEEHALADKLDGQFHLTGQGQSVAEAVLRFQTNVATADRLAPLLDRICEDHQELVIEPFADATVTAATPEDPYRPVRRFLDLLKASDTFRGFNTTHLVPPSTGDEFDTIFADTETEIITLPAVVETLREMGVQGDSDGLNEDTLTLRTRETLPYGLAIFDDRVGIGGFDEVTGAMRVFVDTDATYAREWADRTYSIYRANSDPTDIADE